jgi:tetratricopeptide (TPR) repeat protein
VSWVLNAYPRAYFHLGFLCVQRRQFERALGYLERALALEPGNPQVICEMAQTLAHLGRWPGALALYEQIQEVGPHISSQDLAMAWRGRGFVLIEMEQLDEAEAAFHTSLELEPDNRLALGELEYIEHLRQGGDPVGAEAIATLGPDATTCAVCHDKVRQGVVVSVDGTPLLICNPCHRKLTKRWWQFWK